MAASGMSKMLDPLATADVISRQAVIPPVLQAPVIILHANLAIVLGLLIILPPLRHYRRELLWCVFAGFSIAYLSLVIMKNGWIGDCGCFTGLVSFKNLTTPLVIDMFFLVVVSGLIFEFNRIVNVEIGQ